MELFSNLALGFSTALAPLPLLYCFFGVLLGTMVGVLPGLGPAATIAMLLPATFALPPELSLIMLAGIYYGAQYGGSTTAILINTPGEASSVVTALDGHQMALQGRGGVALASAAIGSFIAGTFATLVIAVFAPILAGFAIRFGPPEYFALMVFGLVGAVVLASGSLLKAFGMVIVGLILGLAGTDITSGTMRMTFGMNNLAEGLNLIAVAMGMFGVAEVIRTLELRDERGDAATLSSRLMPDRSEWRQIRGPIARGSLVGSALGVLPGGGALLASFASYALEKKISSQPSRFGKGAIEGVAGPEAANNASAAGTLVPLLSLGLPTTATAAIMLAGFQQYGLQPGPLLFTTNAPLVWGLIASLLIANFMLLILNLPLIGLWVKLLTIPKPWLYAGILLFATLGTMGANPSVFELGLLLAFGLMGYGLRVFGFPIAPVVVGLILGPMAEQQLRRALAISQGDVTTLLASPIAVTLLVLAAIALFVPLILRARGKGKVLADLAVDSD